MPDNDEPPRRPRRHWFQFSLSTLLLATLLAAVLLAWQRTRLSRWIESLWPERAVELVGDSRDARQLVRDFLQHSRSGNREEADKLLSRKARNVRRASIRVFVMATLMRFSLKGELMARLRDAIEP